MSLWYDKKGKTYATKGSSSWIKYYAEHLVNALTARLEGHYKGAEGKHRAETVLVDDTTSVTDALNTKVDKVAGFGLSQQDYTYAEKQKLAGITPKATAIGFPLEPKGSEGFNDPENRSNIPYAHIEGRKNLAQLRTFLIQSYTKNTVTLDSVSGIQPGMSWFLFLRIGSGHQRYSGRVISIQGKTVTLEGNTEQTKHSELDIAFTPATTPSFFGTFFVNGGSIGSWLITDTDGEFSCHLEGRNTTGTLDAHAEGCYTKALGYSSHAEGKEAISQGECSHAEGYAALASGIGSHAEGGSCQSVGFYSHAEGGNTTAEGKCSHSEGDATIASGTNAHAEGASGTASGENAHSEGSHCLASGKNAHSEGDTSTSSGENAHCEGNNCIASGKSAHSEGGTNQATGNYSHAEGSVCVASGTNAHAEGGGSSATAFCAHAEGGYTTSSGSYSHTEGYQTIATKSSSHAEGQGSEALADCSHAEGQGTKATNKRAHAEGANTTASGINAHAEGGSSVASGGSSHAEGEATLAKGSYSHAEGFGTKALSSSQHVQGMYNLEDATGTYAHIVGNGDSDSLRSNAYTLDWQGNGRYAGDVYAKGEVLATKDYVDSTVSDAGGGDMLRNVYDADHNGIVDDSERLGGQLPEYYAKQSDMDAKPIRKDSGLSSAILWDEEGYQYTSIRPRASGDYSFAANFETDASGEASTALGATNTSSGYAAFTAGSSNHATGNYAFAVGFDNYAHHFQTVVGKAAQQHAGAMDSNDISGTAFMVGNGDRYFNTAFRTTFDGHCYTQRGFAASGSGYAEYFEWADQNLTGEDRRGYFVTLEGGKIRKAKASDSYILGVVAATPCIAGNAYTEQWCEKFQSDIFDQPLTELKEIPEKTNTSTGVVTPAYQIKTFVLNPEYEPVLPYLGRNERPEWSPVGMVGQFVVIDDGTCQVDGFCQVVDGGIATHSNSTTGFRVMERLDDTHVRIILK